MMNQPANEADQAIPEAILTIIEDFIRSEDVKMNLRVEINVALWKAYDEGYSDRDKHE